MSMSKLTEIHDFIVKIIELIGFEYDSIESEEVTEDGKTFLKYNVITNHPQIIIGHHGEVLFSIQQITRMATKKLLGDESASIIVDVDNYRKNQEGNAIEMAQKAINQVLKTGAPVKLVNMPSYKRRSIHREIAEKHDNLETISEGDGDSRHIIIKIKNT